MLDEKIEVIRKYLQVEFPEQIIENQYDFDLGTQIFRISKADHPYILRVAQEFIDDNDPSNIEVILRRHNVAKFIREARCLKVLLRSTGTEMLPD